MITSINGVKAEWDDDIKEKWNKVISKFKEDKKNGEVTDCNYFTPRPYMNEYDTGSEDEGFVYAIGRSVGCTIM